ncbi:hypothetical protein [Oceanobacillus chungangensis]|uniref:Uncharacterized protein n=1 Tax=Oceanobacillus chungangensis TaxID=1229152 RepID=A0A3D8PLZ5_9BACI|nr:hypothetical protein [Oceanobacillus chungangensis]RDW16682.1 hypothetical protein CWR45_13705 [Oceanobacillus chungangensis]
MKLYQIRRGQFVYYNNALHKVYGIKAMYKQSVHLIRLRDLTQHLTKAVHVERYKPKELDSFNFNQKAYTLRNQKAEEGDYILIHNPRPDSLDTYSLNEIEMVETADNKGIITSNSHGVKHNEYLLMEPGRDKNGHPIDFKDIETADSANLQDMESQELSNLTSELLPSIGDIYKRVDNTELYEAMVVAVTDDLVYLGNGTVVSPLELLNADEWEYLYNLQDDDT